MNKRYSQDSPELLKLIINKQLENYGVTMEHVLENPEIEGKPWYQHYTFDSKQEYDNWRNFCKELFTKKVFPKVSVKRFENSFVWIDLQYGLKRNYE